MNTVEKFTFFDGAFGGSGGCRGGMAVPFENIESEEKDDIRGGGRERDEERNQRIIRTKIIPDRGRPSGSIGG